MSKRAFKSFILPIIPLFLASSLFAQYTSTDSLLNILSNLPEGEEKVDVLNQLSYSSYRSDVLETMKYGEAALALAEKINYERGVAQAYNYLAIGYDMQGDADKSMELNEKSLELAKKINATELMVNAMNDMAISIGQQGNPEKALSLYHEALSLAEKDNFLFGISLVSGNIGAMHQYTNNDIGKAKEYYSKSIKNAKKNNDLTSVGWIYQSLGCIASERGEEIEAENYFEQAYKIAENIDDKTSMNEVKIELSTHHLKKGNYELAKIHANDAIEIIKGVGNKEREIYSNFSLINAYRKSQELDKALTLALRTLPMAEKIPHKYPLMYIHQKLSNIYADRLDYKNAFKHNQHFLATKDSIHSDEKEKYLSDLEEKYQLEKKESENAILRAEQKEQEATLKQQQILSYGLAAVTLLSILLGFSILRAYKGKSKSNKELEEKVKERTIQLEKSNLRLKKSNAELEKFAYAASHDLKEPLRNIISFTGLLKREIKDTDNKNAHEYMEYISESTRQMHELVQDILAFSRLPVDNEKVEQLDLNQILRTIKHSIFGIGNPESTSIQAKKNLPKIIGNPSQIYSLFKNLIENGLKYNESENPLVTIDFEENEGEYIFCFSDNGIGIEKEFSEKIFEMFQRLHNRQEYDGTGLGLAFCKKIVHSMNGEIWVESKPKYGSKFYFSIPIDKTVKQEKINDLKSTFAH